MSVSGSVSGSGDGSGSCIDIGYSNNLSDFKLKVINVFIMFMLS